MESRSLVERARHDTILPFTRYLAGPADYTTMVFGERRADSTWAHQVASLATFASPMLTIAAHPQSVLDNPALDVIPQHSAGLGRDPRSCRSPDRPAVRLRPPPGRCGCSPSWRAASLRA